MGMESEREYKELVEAEAKKVADLMQAMRKFLGSNDMMAYLIMMTIRLIEMRKVLKVYCFSSRVRKSRF